MRASRVTVQPLVGWYNLAAEAHPGLASVSKNYLVECALFVLTQVPPSLLPELPPKPKPPHVAGGEARGKQLKGKPAINPALAEGRKRRKGKVEK